MDYTVTLHLPTRLASVAQEQARRSRRTVEEVLVDWLDQAVADTPVELLSDQDVLEVAHHVWDDERQQQLSELLALNREEQLTEAQQRQLDTLMDAYRGEMVRKAKAYQEAVRRGLLPRLS